MSNPMFNDEVIRSNSTRGDAWGAVQSDTMTIEGTATKTGILLVIAFATAIVSWNLLKGGHPASNGLMIGGALVGFLVVLFARFKPEWSAVTGPIYAAAEGFFLGGISAVFEHVYHGIVLQAVCLTFGTCFMMMIAYRTGFIQATERFKTGVFAAVGGIMLVYLASFVMGFFGMSIPFIGGSGPIGILFSVGVVCIAALMLIIHFDSIEKGAHYGMPRYMEWYSALSLLVTIVWLYVEILILLAKLQGDE